MSSERRRPAPSESVRHARRRIARIPEWTAQDTEASFLGNTERQDAVERNFIAIGEAIKDLARGLDLQKADPAAPWRESARFRDFLAHQYEDGVSHPDVWRTIKEDLPELDAALARLAGRLGPE
jgi:uncharacterized protein with HEPN domain